VREEHEVVALTDADDAGLHAAPQKHAVVGRLATAAGVERRSVQHDTGFVRLGSAVQDGGVPLTQRLVGELEPMGAPMPLLVHRLSVCTPSVER